MTEISSTARDNLVTAYEAAAAEMAALTASTAGGKPNTNQPGAVDHHQYLVDMCKIRMECIRNEIAELDKILDAGEEFGAITISQGIV